MNIFQRIFLGMALAALASGCVYRINIQQGNFLDQTAVEQVKSGMTRSQVRYLLGTPMVADSFNKERWDYIYYLKKGRSRHVDSRRVTVYFDGDKVVPEGLPNAIMRKMFVENALDTYPRLRDGDGSGAKPRTEETVP